MKTHFHITNKDFSDYLKITTQEKEYFFCDDLTIEYDDCDNLDIDVELIKAEDYLNMKAKNFFLRLLLNVAKWILALLLYVIDNENGIGLDKGYHSFNPFTIKQSFSINSPNEKTISITYTASSYDKITKKFTPPKLKYQEDILIKTENVTFSPPTLKREWNTYHIPALTVIMVMIVLLGWLNFSIFAKVIRETPIYLISENIGRIIGMSFCSLVMIALLVAYVVVIIKARKLYKKVLTANL